MNTEVLQGEEKRHQEKVKYPIHTAATNSKHSAKPSLTSTKPHVVDLFISVPVSSFELKITMHAKDKKKKTQSKETREPDSGKLYRCWNYQTGNFE